MKLLARRREAELAQVQLQRERHRWQTDTETLRACFARHRGSIAVGTGAVVGLLCGVIPIRGATRFGRIVANVSVFVLRTPIGVMLIDAIRHRGPTNKVAPSDTGQ